jgi:hypothetical protein
MQSNKYTTAYTVVDAYAEVTRASSVAREARATAALALTGEGDWTPREVDAIIIARDKACAALEKARDRLRDAVLTCR